MDHLLRVRAGELHAAPVALRLGRVPLPAPLHRGLHGRLQPADGRVHVHPGPGGRHDLWRVWSPRRPLGGRSRLPGDGLGVGVLLRGQRAAADAGGRAVRRERDVRPGLRQVPVTRQRSRLFPLLPHPLSHPGLPPVGGSGGVRLLAVLPAFPPAALVLPAPLLHRLPPGSDHDEHPVPADSDRLLHPPVLGAAEGRV